MVNFLDCNSLVNFKGALFTLVENNCFSTKAEIKRPRNKKTNIKICLFILESVDNEAALVSSVSLMTTFSILLTVLTVLSFTSSTLDMAASTLEMVGTATLALALSSSFFFFFSILDKVLLLLEIQGCCCDLRTLFNVGA